MELFKNKKVWIGLVLASVITIMLGELAALVFLGACFGIWYFKKKKPNKDYSTISICLAVISFFVIGFSGTDAESDSSVATVEVEESTSESVESSTEEELAAIEESKQKKEETEKAKENAESEKIEEGRKKAEAESTAAVEKEELEKKTLEIQGTAPSVPNGVTYVEVNGNVPLFTNEDISSTEAWDEYGEMDSLGRVTIANAVLGTELMPAEERGDISDIYPTGWEQEEYGNVSGGWLYNRSHLIGHQLTGYDDANNLITGTRYFNVEGMLPFENFVADYVETTDNHVRYRVTPYFEGNNLLASGIYMEGFSIEDNGEELQFHIYVPNIQPGVTLDYTNGDSRSDEPVVEDKPIIEEVPEEPVVETAPSGGDLGSVDASGNGEVTIQEAKDAGFSMPIYSDHWLYQYMDDRDKDGMVGE